MPFGLDFFSEVAVFDKLEDQVECILPVAEQVFDCEILIVDLQVLPELPTVCFVKGANGQKMFYREQALAVFARSFLEFTAKNTMCELSKSGSKSEENDFFPF